MAVDAGLLVNPHSDEEIADAMVQMATNAELRARLIENAKVQRQKFSWDKSAVDLWNGMMRLME